MPPSRTLIFCNSKKGVDYLDDFLYNLGMPTTSIHADRTQREREDALYVVIHLPLLTNAYFSTGVPSELVNAPSSLLLLSPLVVLMSATSCTLSTMTYLAWTTTALTNMFTELVCLSFITRIVSAKYLQAVLLVSETRA